MCTCTRVLTQSHKYPSSSYHTHAHTHTRKHPFAYHQLFKVQCSLISSSSKRTESVSKFFRVGSSSQSKSDSTPATPKSARFDDSSKYLVRNIDGEDNISLVSLGSQASLNSHVSSSFGTFDIINRTEDSLPEIEFLADADIAEIKIDSNASQQDANITYTDSPLSIVQQTPKHQIDAPLPSKDIWIGHITEQPLINYTVRLIASKFLLTGTPNELVSDKIVRVSIKSLSLLVLGNCIDFCPHVLQLGLPITESSLCIGDFFQSFDSDDDDYNDDDDDSMSVEPATVEEKQSEPKQDDGNELVIKDDHFGESSSSASNAYFDFMSPLSKSADNVLLSQLKSIDSHYVTKKNTKLSTELNDLLSKSDIVESKSSYMRADRILSAESTPKKIMCKTPVKHLIKYDEIDENQQLVEDILHYFNHPDPILRANTQIIVGNFIAAVLVQTGCFTKFLHENRERKPRTFSYLQFNKLLHILLKVSQNLYYPFNIITKPQRL